MTDRAGRCPDEVSYEKQVGPLDRTDWPQVGDEVLYRHHRTGYWQPAVVVAVAEHDGDLELDYGRGPNLSVLDSKHGTGRACWLLYREAERVVPKKPWSAITCEVCEGFGERENDLKRIVPCWYCRGAG
jgi:hypothetical protein